ncbi:peptidyl-tRNA hydrolase [candidate division SR1 bacterium]|nr:peptidyl-tRNA hydrolase [candidate division SR1 bacterium]
MKLIVGLGNPGSQYRNTRHNIGETMLSRFLEKRNKKLKYDSKFVAEILKDDEIVYAFPQTFMNLSGNAVESIARFYKIHPRDILVLHDEIDFPTGKIALKIGGGTAGHNGLKSISEKLGNGEYQRIRIGIGRPEEGKKTVSDYVLSKFKPDEIQILEEKESEIFGLVENFLLN